MPVRLTAEPFAPWEALAEHARALDPRQCGATATFVGGMRDFNEGESVRGMFLEHYPGMTEQALQRICAEAGRRWEILDTLIVHRVGRVRPGETLVLVAAWAAHRAPAFAACRYLIEELKARAPFWKQEELGDGSRRWVEHNTPGEVDA